MTQLFLLGTAIRKPRRGGGGGGVVGGGDCLPVSFKIFKTCLANFRSAATKERKRLYNWKLQSDRRGNVQNLNQ